jgi:hypothetical protein
VGFTSGTFSPGWLQAGSATLAGMDGKSTCRSVRGR